MDLEDLHSLLNKWQRAAYLEMRDPGSYYRLRPGAEQIRRAEDKLYAVTDEQTQALIRERLGRQVYRIVPYSATIEQVALKVDYQSAAADEQVPTAHRRTGLLAATASGRHAYLSRIRPSSPRGGARGCYQGGGRVEAAVAQ